jgi:hypothetical protein
MSTEHVIYWTCLCWLWCFFTKRTEVKPFSIWCLIVIIDLSYLLFCARNESDWTSLISLNIFYNAWITVDEATGSHCRIGTDFLTNSTQSFISRNFKTSICSLSSWTSEQENMYKSKNIFVQTNKQTNKSGTTKDKKTDLGRIRRGWNWLLWCHKAILTIPPLQKFKNKNSHWQNIFTVI